MQALRAWDKLPETNGEGPGFEQEWVAQDGGVAG